MTKDELKQELLRYRNCKESFQQVSTFLVETEHRMSKILGSEAPTAELISQYVTLQEAYRSTEIELTDAQIHIEDLIECLDSRERYLMRCYYIQGMTWEEVCHTAGYCLRTAHRIHSEALRRILQKMPQLIFAQNPNCLGINPPQIENQPPADSQKLRTCVFSSVN